MQIKPIPKKSNVCKISFIQENGQLTPNNQRKKIYSILFITQGHLNGF